MKDRVLLQVVRKTGQVLKTRAKRRDVKTLVDYWVRNPLVEKVIVIGG